MHDLDIFQKDAVLAENKTIIAIAGAGSGKTSTLVARVNHLIDKGEDPTKIYCITFTNTAADEIDGRLNESIGYVGTLHSLGYLHLKKINPSLTLIDEQEVIEVLLDISDIVGYKTKSKSKILDLYKRFNFITEEKEIAIKNLYLNKVKTQNLIDYDLILKQFSSYLENKIIKLDIDNLLVDEFQDTSLEDMNCYLNLNSKKHFLVGDPRQAIYQFRGASSNFLNNAEEYFTDIKKCYLTNNYRSNQTICSTCNIIAKDYPEMVSAVDDKFENAIDFFPKVIEFDDEYDEHHYILGVLNNFLSFHEKGESIALLFRTHAVKEKYKKLLLQYGLISVSEGKGYRDNINLCKILLNVFMNPSNFFSNKRYLDFIGASSAVTIEKLKNLPIINFDENKTVQQNLLVNGITQNFLDAVSFNETCNNNIFNAIEYLQEFEKASMTQDNLISLSTVHAAKGKEWSHVIIPECNNFNFPFKGVDTTEERNIFYVACSRAKTNLLMTCSKYYSTKYGREGSCDKTIYI